MSETARPPYHALRHRDFRLLWGAQFLSLVGTQMQTVALNWHVYLLTHSPLALGAVGLTRVLPIIAFSLFGGVLADRADRRRVIFAAQLAMAIFSAVLAAVTFSGHATLALLYVCNGLTAAASAFDNPARNALVPRLVPREDLPGALALNLTMFHSAVIAGPGLAGLFIARSGTQPVAALGALYTANALSFVSVLAAVAMMKTSGRAATDDTLHEPPLQALKAGLRFVFTTPIMVWTTALDFFATFFSGSLSLLPVFADKVLGVGPAGYGWLVAAPAAGALLGSIYTSTRPLPRHQGRLLLWSVGAYGLATIVYGLSSAFWLTVLALAGTGLADVISTVIRQVLRQVVTPDALRGRMTSVNMIFFMGGPQLGEMEAGLVASLFASAALGVRVSVVSGGLITLLCAAIVAWKAAVVRRYVHD